MFILNLMFNSSFPLIRIWIESSKEKQAGLLPLMCLPLTWSGKLKESAMSVQLVCKLDNYKGSSWWKTTNNIKARENKKTKSIGLSFHVLFKTKTEGKQTNIWRKWKKRLAKPKRLLIVLYVCVLFALWMIFFDFASSSPHKQQKLLNTAFVAYKQ